MTDAIEIASGLKTSVGEYYQVLGSFTGANSGAVSIPAAVANNAGKYADSVSVADGVITAVMRASGVASCVQGGIGHPEPDRGRDNGRADHVVLQHRRRFAGLLPDVLLRLIRLQCNDWEGGPCGPFFFSVER